MRILLLSAYDAVSHRQWREALVVAFPDYEWTILSLPARYFNWRIRGNSVSWAFQYRDMLQQPYDLIIATSMVDLSSLRGFVSELTQIPTLVYFHENQFNYPNNRSVSATIEPQILNLYTALAADNVLFNSQYNQKTFLDGAQQLLKKMPDHVPVGLVELLQSKSQVLPVPVKEHFFQQRIQIYKPDEPLSILWNHRWEYDKAPERFFAVIKQLLDKDIKLSISVVGQQFRDRPKIFDEMKSILDGQFPEVINQWGFIDKKVDYLSLLMSSDVVVSTALHDFQGLAVLEAVASGCIPVLPKRLCYGEWFDEHYLYDSSIELAAHDIDHLFDHIEHLALLKKQDQLPAIPDVKWLSVNSLKRRYQKIFEQTINQHSLRSNDPVL